MVFTMYKENVNIGDIFYLDKDNLLGAELNMIFNPYQEEKVVYCVITKVNDNQSINGTIINALVDYGEPSFTAMASAYTGGNHTHFMWCNKIYIVDASTKKDLVNRYPEKFI